MKLAKSLNRLGTETAFSVLAEAKNQKFNPNIYFDITKFIKKMN